MSDEQPGSFPEDRSSEPVGPAPLEVAPLDVDGVRTIEIGTLVWLVAFLGLLPFYGRLHEDGHAWWLWTCLAGFGLGALGVEWLRRRRNHRQRQL